MESLERNNKLPKRVGRPKLPVREKLEMLLPDAFSGPITSELKEQHWRWPEMRPNLRKRVFDKNSGKMIDRFVQQPARVRDDNGRLVAVIRLLHEIFRDAPYPYPILRSRGCGHDCVNPWHLKYPAGLEPEGEEPDIPESSDEIAELAEQIEEFIGINGVNKDRILERFLLDYEEDEINEALERVKWEATKRP